MGRLPTATVLHMLRVTIAFAVTFTLLTTGVAISEERQELPALPGVGQVDMQGVQEKIDALLEKTKNQRIQIAPQTKHDGKEEPKNSPEQEEARDASASKAVAEEAAQCAMRQFHANDRQQEVRQETNRMQRELFSRGAVAPQVEQSEGPLGEGEMVYVFLSSSMPEDMTRAYLSRIAAITGSKVVPVMYGLVQGLEGKEATAEYIGQIMKVDGNCQDLPEVQCDRLAVEIGINPMLFKKYGVEVVPGVVYDNGKDWWIIQGDATLDYLLEQINREAKSQAVDSLIATMRRKNP